MPSVQSTLRPVSAIRILTAVVGSVGPRAQTVNVFELSPRMQGARENAELHRHRGRHREGRRGVSHALLGSKEALAWVRGLGEQVVVPLRVLVGAFQKRIWMACLLRSSLRLHLPRVERAPHACRQHVALRMQGGTPRIRTTRRGTQSRGDP